MDRQKLMAHVAERYGVDPEFPWSRWPSYAVFRHRGNRKWFGVVMNVPPARLGLEGDDEVDILNVKVEPDDAVVLRLADSILPAYHMNKENWISVVIDGNVPDDLLLDLLETSHRLTS